VKRGSPARLARPVSAPNRRGGSGSESEGEKKDERRTSRLKEVRPVWSGAELGSCTGSCTRLRLRKARLRNRLGGSAGEIAMGMGGGCN
jgi:hypothetical protein